MKYCIARFQEGVCLNPYEYLLDDNNVMLEFDTKQMAVDHLNKATQSDLTLDQWQDEGVYIEPAEQCPNCNSHNVRDDFDFPDTMRCCESCGADFNIEGELTFDPNSLN